VLAVKLLRPILSATVALATLSCGGSSGPGPGQPTGNQPTPRPTATATTTPTPAPTSAGPAGVVACPYGNGSLSARCTRDSSTHSAAVEKAIDDLIRAQPRIFNLNDQLSDGTPLVVNTADYFNGIVQQLQGAGFCAESDGFQNVKLKRSADLSETYAILTSSGYVRRGGGAYRESCRPSSFPIDESTYIDAVRVHFYSIRCPEGIVPPDNAEKKLPVGCTGWVSATPKDVNNRDVPPAIHGPDIYWEYFQGEGEHLAKVSDVPDQPFNKWVDGLDAGYFTMCATVKKVRGCFGFDIIR
jgi:hypothetical protein